MKYMVLVFIVLLSPLSHSWQTVSGKVESISLYSGRDMVLVNLDKPGVNNPDCSNATSFAIASSVPEDRKNAMLCLKIFY